MFECAPHKLYPNIIIIFVGFRCLVWMMAVVLVFVVHQHTIAKERNIPCMLASMCVITDNYCENKKRTRNYLCDFYKNKQKNQNMAIFVIFNKR